MTKTHIEAWDDLMRRAEKTAGVKVHFNHAGIAVMERLPDPPQPAAASATPDASSSSGPRSAGQ